MKYIRTPKPKRERSHLPVRLNILFFVVFVLLAMLVGQLAYLQLQNGAHFRGTIDSADTTVVTAAVPRGNIYDSTGKPLVANSAHPAITYTKGLGVTADKMRETADNLNKYITVTVDGMQPRDYADYYLAKPENEKAVSKKLPKALQKSKDASLVYEAEVEYAKKHLPKMSEEETRAAYIFKKLNGAQQLTTVFVKPEGVTTEESARVGEHLQEMSGIGLGVNWQRDFPSGNSVKSIIGTVSTEKAGLPEAEVNEYLAKGYARNDRVGTSYLEKQYEDILKGAKSRSKVEIGRNNDILSSVSEFAGQPGENLNLTINAAFQDKVQSALKKQLDVAVRAGQAKYTDGAYAVAMDPNTGAILAMAGLNHDLKTGEITPDSLGVLTRSFTMGSIAKPAMVLGALQDGVITVDNNRLSDFPIYLPGTNVKKSVYPIGTYSTVDVKKALEVSSNTYMMQLAMKEGKAKYVPHSSMTMDDGIFNKMRGYFQQFGLGLRTGIDLPGEVTGIQGADRLGSQLAVGSVLDLSYGNLDTYTLLQEVQYVSAVANNGYRMKPFILQSVSKNLENGQNGPVISTTTPQVVSQVKNTAAQFDLVRTGMWQAVHGHDSWTTATVMRDLNPGVAGKTGTAQTFTRADFNNPNSPQVETISESFIGFAPAKNPQVAIAVVIPNLSDGSSIANVAARDIFAAYYDVYGVPKDKKYNANSQNIN